MTLISQKAKVDKAFTTQKEFYSVLLCVLIRKGGLFQLTTLYQNGW